MVTAAAASTPRTPDARDTALAVARAVDAAPALAAAPTLTAPTVAPRLDPFPDTFQRGPRAPGYAGAFHVEKTAAAPQATAGAQITPPAHLTDMVKGTKGDLKKDFQAATDAIKSGDYEAASKKMAAIFRDDERIQGQLGTQGVDQTEALKGQVDFLAKMKKAGVTADFPPTEAQLTQYFGTLKGKPDQAKADFQEYVGAFHVNPKQAGVGDQVTYTQGKTVSKTKGGQKVDVPVQNPTTWKEVTTDRQQIKEGRYAGMSVNDCEGYALLGHKLLGAAGFKVENFVVGDGPQMGHQMLMMKDPKGGRVLISNDRLFEGGSADDLQRRGLAYSFGPDAELEGKVKFYTGGTMADAQAAYTLAKM